MSMAPITFAPERLEEAAGKVPEGGPLVSRATVHAMLELHLGNRLEQQQVSHEWDVSQDVAGVLNAPGYST